MIHSIASGCFWSGCRICSISWSRWIYRPQQLRRSNDTRSKWNDYGDARSMRSILRGSVMSPVSTKIKDAIRLLTLKAAQEPESSVNRTVAAALGALSVYADMGGALALTPEGEVVHYDFENGATTIPDQNMQIFARVRAAQRFPELQELAPQRPDSATSCPICEGRGEIVYGMYCGNCCGTGWV